MRMDLLNRFINLARVFLEGRGLPFLGAGVSMGARAHYAQEIIPTVKWMIEQVVTDRVLNKLLCENEQERKEKQAELFALLGKELAELVQERKGETGSEAKACGFTSRDELREAILETVDGRLGVFCDALNLLGLLNHHDVVRAMRIWDFSKLEPTPAHYYIAFLAQEALVNEVITTNYDCCLERAAFYVNGLDGDGRPPMQRKVQPAISIANIECYREHGSRRLRLDHSRNTVVLRTFKINGCAGRLERKDRDEVADLDSILLTERQLQHMDDRAWARDLLRDRARSRSLVFSGFGSDEPQVRFTVLRLLEELVSRKSSVDQPGNAIWLHLYGEELSFAQQQIMHSYWADSESRIPSFIFSGKDRRAIDRIIQGEKSGATKTAKSLDANTFWKVVFEIVFLALIEKYTRPSSPGWLLFSELDSPNRTIIRRKMFMDWLDPQGIGKLVITGKEFAFGKSGNNHATSLKTVDSLLSFCEQKNWNGIQLCRWIRCFTRRDKAGKKKWLPEVNYFNLMHHLSLVLPLLMICCFFGEETFFPLKTFLVPLKEEYSSRPPFLVFHLFGRRILLLDRLRAMDIIPGAWELADRVNFLVGYRQETSPFFQSAPKTFFFTTINDHRIWIHRWLSVPILELMRIGLRILEAHPHSDSSGTDDETARRKDHHLMLELWREHPVQKQRLHRARIRPCRAPGGTSDNE